MSAVLVVLGVLVGWLVLFVGALCIHDYLRVRAIRRSFAVKEAAWVARTPEQVEADTRAACIALAGFDPDMVFRSKATGKNEQAPNADQRYRNG